MMKTKRFWKFLKFIFLLFILYVETVPFYGMYLTIWTDTPLLPQEEDVFGFEEEREPIVSQMYQPFSRLKLEMAIV